MRQIQALTRCICNDAESNDTWLTRQKAFLLLLFLFLSSGMMNCATSLGRDAGHDDGAF